MSTNLEKLTHAGIVGTPHTISHEDKHLLESLTEHEVNTLIAIKAKLNPPHGGLRETPGGPQPVGTVSF